MRNESGMTLVELLTVAMFIGILAALAIPNYFLFKSNANDSSAASDARNIATAAEMVASEGGLDDLLILDGSGGPIAELPGGITSPGTVGTIEVGANRYVIEFEHANGNKRFRNDSESGQTVVDG